MAEAMHDTATPKQGVFAVFSAVFYAATVLIFAGSYLGCAAMAPETEVAPVLLPAAEQQVAATAADDGEYRTALHYWRQARDKVDARIENISGRLQRISQWYAEIGARFYQEKKGKKALAEFLEALRRNPENRLALEYLKHKYIPRQWISYTVRVNETIASIAEAVYGSAFDGFAVVHFAGIDEKSALVAGSEIQLPRLDSFYSPQLLDYKKNILRARTLYTAKDFAELLPLAERILANHPEDEEASYLLGSALVGLGEELRRRQKYEQAIEVLSRVDPLFKDVEEDIVEIRNLEEQQLAQDTAVMNACLFKKAEALLDNDQYLQALKVLEEIDPEYAGVRKATADLRTILMEQADIHYKQGVAFFVDDNLAAAIDVWQMTLRYDPDHEQAAANIAKARSLLKKVKSID